MTTKLDELKALISKASSLPWAVDPDDRPRMEWNNHIVQVYDPNMTICFMTHDNTPENVEGFANADLITIGINALPALIAAVEALRDAYSVGQIVGGSKKAAQAALAPFGE